MKKLKCIFCGNYLSPCESIRQSLGFCTGCDLLHDLGDIPPHSVQSLILPDGYARFACEIFDELYSIDEPFVVEIGSGSGSFLAYIDAYDIHHLGIDPCLTETKIALDRGVNAIAQSFSESLAKRIVFEHGKADVVIAIGVLSGVPDPANWLNGVDHLLKEEGALIVEDLYLGDFIRSARWRCRYYFSATAIQNIASKVGLELVDVKKDALFKGAMRYILTRQGQYPISESVLKLVADEKESGLDRLSARKWIPSKPVLGHLPF